MTKSGLRNLKAPVSFDLGAHILKTNLLKAKIRSISRQISVWALNPSVTAQRQTLGSRMLPRW